MHRRWPGSSYAFGSGAMTNPISSLAQSDAILVVGSNTTEQHPLVASYILQARSKGAKLIVVDPRRTQLADSGRSASHAPARN